jgi:hypothetical protein
VDTDDGITLTLIYIMHSNSATTIEIVVPEGEFLIDK